MSIKRKNILVIFVSSVIIAGVFVFTLIGYSLYVQWKKDSFALKYRESVYKLTSELFKKEIVLSNVSAGIGEGEPFQGVPLLEGSLRNNSKKTITSIRIKVFFLNNNETVIYSDRFYPLGGQQGLGGPGSFFSSMQPTKNVLQPGEGISFRHLLRNCPREIKTQLATSPNFSKDSAEDKMELNYQITGLSVL